MSLAPYSTAGPAIRLNRQKFAANGIRFGNLLREPERRRLAATAGLFAFWVLFAAVEVAKDWHVLDSAGRPFPLARHAWHAAFVFLPWFALSLLVGWLAQYRAGGGRRPLGIGAHLLLAGAFGLVHLLIVTASFWVFAFRGSMAPGFAAAYVDQLFKWMHFEILVYFAVLLFWRVLLKRPALQPRPKLVGKADGETCIAGLEQVDWIGSDDGRTTAHVGAMRIRLHSSLRELASKHAAHGYVRVHRSAIVNAGRLRRIDGMVAVMANGDRVKCSRAGKQALRRLLADICG